ncbi:uncharacterized protein C8A04DRAFT_38167 [Dichotomopilus funicola]|uniref:MGS207 protein n=1 Tax=Dichotomopilus funicola TaxID=1934379 RepID=A0AAN6ZKI2_9PEZI|nr:hypothetical protein C8A04DRAFT_38167 [Dichotomopilus funicola]
MASILSYLPLVNRLLAAPSEPPAVKLTPVEVFNVETNPDKRARTLKHLLRANHVNHALLYRNLQFDNHMVYALCTAYQLGAGPEQLHYVYNEEAKLLLPWPDSPGQIAEDNWVDCVGDKHYQRAFIDFFEDELALKHAYDWRKMVPEFLFHPERPLVSCLVGGLGHPLIHLAYAYEFDSRTIAVEAITQAAIQHNFLHRYTDDPSYTRPSPFSSSSPRDLFQKLSHDTRFDGLFGTPGWRNVKALFDHHEDLLLDYWNAWDLTPPQGAASGGGNDITAHFRAAQSAAFSVVIASAAPGTAAYNLFLVHILTTSHAVRILLPHIPARYHVLLLRQWWLLALAVYIGMLRPKINDDWIPSEPEYLEGKGWEYAEKKAMASEWRGDAHYIKTVWMLRGAATTWGDENNRYLAGAVRFVDEFKGWVDPGYGSKEFVEWDI